MIDPSEGDERGRPGRPPNAATRVSDVHRQTRRGLELAGVMVVGAGAAVVIPHETGAWLPLHLVLVGAALLVIGAVTQMLAVTWSSAPAPSAVLAGLQRWSVAIGAVLVAAGREKDSPTLVVVGAASVGGGLAALAVSLLQIRARARTDRFFPAIDAYLAAVMFGIVGISLGVTVALSDGGDDLGHLRDAHLTVNLLGLVGIVIAGTLPYFSATQTRMKMNSRASPLTLRVHVGILGSSTVLAAVGAGVGESGVAGAGLALYAIGLVVVAALVVRPGRRQLVWAGPRLVQLGAGWAWWTGGVVALATTSWWHWPGERPALVAIVLGGFAQIVVSSLAYLLPVLRGGGHERLSEGFAVTRSWMSLALANAATIAAIGGADEVAAVLVGAWAIGAAVTVARLAVKSTTSGVQSRSS